MQWSYIAIGLLIIGILYLLFAYPKTDRAPPPIVRAPNAASASPSPVEQLKGAPAPHASNGGSSKVVELQTYEETALFLSKGPGILLVYAPWCGHCKNMMPAYDGASNVSALTKFAKVEGSKVPRLMSEHQIRGFPTLLTIKKDGTVERYNSGRDMSSLVSAANTLAN